MVNHAFPQKHVTKVYSVVYTMAIQTIQSSTLFYCWTASIDEPCSNFRSTNPSDGGHKLAGTNWRAP